MKTKLLSLFVALIATSALWASKVITYTAASKLPETTSSSSSGLHTNAFNVTMSSHAFAKGQGTITFSGEVTTIGDYAFYKCSGLTSVTIPNSVTTIGERAFNMCSGLTSITIPNSVTTIGERAFQDCDGLTSVSIPNSVITIGVGAFYDCNDLTFAVYNANCFAYMPTSYQGSYTIPNGIKQIAGQAFCDCSGLTSVTIPNSVTTIGEKAFCDCSGLTSVTIGNSVTTIGESAFYKCSGLTKTNYTGTIADWCKIKFSNDIANSMYYSHNFYINDVEVKDLVIPGGVTTIENRAFCDCSGLTSVTIGNSVTTIEASAFSGCSGLTSVTIGNSVTTIGGGAFYFCSGLTSVTIPNSVTTIGGGAFYICSGLRSVTLNSNAIVSKNYTSSNNIKNIFGTQVTEYIIGNSVTTIGKDAFSGCSDLKSVTIPNSVTTIGEKAFNGCRGLTSAVYNANCFAYLPTSYQGGYTIPDGIIQIAGGAFNDCSGLTSVTIPNSVTTIGYGAFSGCSGLPIIDGIRYADTYLIEAVDTSLDTYTIQDGTRWIGDMAFDGCNGLTSVTIPNSVTTIGDYAFEDCSGLRSVTLNSNAIVSKNYTSSNNIKNIFGTQVTEYIIGDFVTTIGSSAFYGCSGLKSVTIPNSVTTIGSSAFYGCSGLKSVTIPNSVTTIGDDAFRGCSGLTSVTIPNSVTTIGERAFDMCSGLKSVTIGNSVTTIGDYAFYYCRGLTSVTIPNSVTAIGYDAFAYCSGLTSVTIGNSVTTIGDYAFEGCSGLTKTNYTGTIADWCKIKFGGSDANPMYYSHNFYINDVEVKDLVIPEGVDTIGDYAFYECHGLTSVTNPNSVTTIGDYAFYGCSGLTAPVYNAHCFVYMPKSYQGAYTIPDGIKQITSYAFYNCSGLTSVTIPNSVTTIGDDAFRGCSGLTSVTIPNSVTTIGKSAFQDCDGLTSVSIPNSVTTIGTYAFRGCSGLTSVTIPNSVTTIGYAAFVDCSGLTSVTIGNSVTTIGDYAFEGCRGLKSITCEAINPPTCGTKCFYYVSKSIPVYVYPKSVQAYRQADGWNEFTKLQENPNDYAMITCLASNGIVTGGGKLIKGDTCTLEVTINYGYHFTQWSDGNTDNPRSFVVTQDSTFTVQTDIAKSGQCGDDLYWKLVGDTLIITGRGEMCDYTEYHLAEWYLSNDKITQLVLPDGLTHIGNYTFANCIGLTSITIPNSVTTIGNSAFEGCNGIKSVTWNAKNCSGYNFGSQVETFVFGDSVEVIPANACSDMTKLTSVTIPNSVTTIGDYAFYGLSNKNLKEISLPNSVETIGKYAFAECSYLKTIILGAKLEDIDEYAFQNDERLLYVNCYAEEPPVLQENAFDNYDIYLQVPCDVLDEYKVAKGWKLFNKENVSCLSAEGKTITSGQVIVTPSVTTAEFVWPADDQADSYSLKITKDGVVFCTLTFNAQGQLRTIAFAPSRSGEQPTRAAQATANGWQFTVTGLNQASKYAYTLDVTNAQKQSIKTYTGEFVTDGYTDLFSVPYNEREGLGAVKFIKDGRLLIERNGVLFNARGARVK